MAVIGRRIYAIGGSDVSNNLDPVEYLEFNETPSEGRGTARSFFQSSVKWKIDHGLALSFARTGHCVVKVEQCLIVIGGRGRQGAAVSVEVLNTKGNTVWNLPTTSTQRTDSGLVATTDGVVVIGGSNTISCESLPLVSMKRYLKVRLLLV